MHAWPISRVLGDYVILFLVIIWSMLLLFVIMFVPVVFMLVMVSFWCEESIWLCYVCRLAE